MTLAIVYPLCKCTSSVSFGISFMPTPLSSPASHYVHIILDNILSMCDQFMISWPIGLSLCSPYENRLSSRVPMHARVILGIKNVCRKKLGNSWWTSKYKMWFLGHILLLSVCALFHQTAGGKFQGWEKDFVTVQKVLDLAVQNWGSGNDYGQPNQSYIEQC